MKNFSVNPNLERERSKNSFVTEELTNILDGSKELSERRRHIEKLVFNDQDLYGLDVRQMERKEQFTELLRRHVKVIQKCQQYRLSSEFDLKHFRRSAMGIHKTGLTYHELVFLPILKKRASAEQLDIWLPLATSFQMIGCHANMELGNNIGNVETTAIYDPSTEEFILNTSTHSSIKWFAGGLGKTANHALIIAQLHSNGEFHGVHTFLVQIRDHNHFQLPGITVGDVGLKIGLRGVDNGFLKLNNVRIPRTNMLMRFSRVLKDGTFNKTKVEISLNGEMTQARMSLCDDAIHILCMSVTIAIRYSCVRQQSTLEKGRDELQVLDYQTQQDKLFPILCTAYAYRMAFPSFKEFFNCTSSRQSEYFDAFIGGLMVMITKECSKDVELCRMACGGHGFSAASNLPSFYMDVVAADHETGDSAALLLQMARYLLSDDNGSSADGMLSFPVDNSSTFQGSFNLESLLEAMGVMTYRLMKKYKEAQKTFLDWNDYSLDLIGFALVHMRYILARTFVKKVVESRGTPSLSRVLENICRLFLVHGLCQSSGDLLEAGYFKSADVDKLREELYRLYDVLRPDAVPLVDAFDFHDRHLTSALGSYRGNVYEELFAWAQQSKLNETEVHPSFSKYLKAMRGFKLC